MWGLAWLFKATNDMSYYNTLKSLGANDQPDIFSWDNKYAGAHVLLSRVRKRKKGKKRKYRDF
uniref:cellulase n=1 Tax=Rhizophora mucronata TaxID=61149 RepID=A0A2P2Q1A1_RHIMU